MEWRNNVLLNSPCVYVRYIPESGKFYIGRTRKGLYVRYGDRKRRSEIIYWELIKEIRELATRENQLIHEFVECGLPLENKDLNPYLEF